VIKATLTNFVPQTVEDVQHGARHVGFCVVCNAALKAERKTRKFCSNACRQKNHRKVPKVC
jgi:predicted nucleic acid-binding Zn ribbon protein